MKTSIMKVVICWTSFLISVGLVISVANAQTPVHYEFQKLMAADGATDDVFGGAVAVDGETIFVGVPLDDAAGWKSGSVYVFRQTDSGQWVQRARITAKDGGEFGFFSRSVVLDGDTALIGASEAAYIFGRDASGEWVEKVKLLPWDGAVNNYFGEKVALDGDTAAVGASLDDDNGVNAGAVYVFMRNSDAAWSGQAKLLASDSGINEHHFGSSVTLADDTILVGALDNERGTMSGAVYAFRRAANGLWEQESKLMASDGDMFDFFGIAATVGGNPVALEGDTALIGAIGDDDNGWQSGSVYVFLRGAAGEWLEDAKLLPEDGGWHDDFGRNIAINRDAAVISGNEGDVNQIEPGTAYLFTRSGSGEWTEQAMLLASDGVNEDIFGRAVALAGRTAVVGAPNDDSVGSAYVFDVSSFLGPTEIAIDFKPDSNNNVINPRSRGRFWVGILSDEAFDAVQVDPASVRLGARAASVDKYLVRDSNYDGVADLLVRFRTPSVGIVCGDISVELTGQTYDGLEIVGEDDLTTVGCEKPKPKKKGKKR